MAIAGFPVVSIFLWCETCETEMDPSQTIQDVNDSGTFTSFKCPHCGHQVRVHVTSKLRMEV